MIHLIRLGCCLLAVCGGSWSVPLKAEEKLAKKTAKVDFVRDIQPILRKSCYSCHGAEKQEGGLRLDSRKRAFQGGDSGAVIVAGKSKGSRLLELVAGTDKDGELMPPEGEGTPLSPAQVTLIRRWIEQGADWPASADSRKGETHWSFQPIRRPAPPATRNRRWAVNPIDAFVLSRQENRKLTPSPPADRATLLRRVYLDMLGVAPDPDVATRFLNDKRPNAYRRLIERVLASPHYGERWGRHWLDLARYADSDGYEKDRARPFAWRYRQWVVQALNGDLAFNEFSRRQIAGDLLDDKAAENLVASGFHRNTLHNTEGGTDPKEDFFKKTVDRTNTMGTIWLGLTVGCAQCHSHKYDPISQREYYRLFAFFNSIDEQNVRAPTASEAARYRAQLADFTAQQKPYIQRVEQYVTKKLPAAQVAWEKTAAAVLPSWKIAKASQTHSTHGASFQRQSDGSYLVSGKNVTSDVYQLEIESALPSLRSVRLEALPDKSLAKKGPGRADNGNFVLANFRVERLDAKGQAFAVPLSQARATFAQKEWPVSAALSSQAKNGWAISPRIGRRQVAVFELAKPLSLAAGERLRITLDHKYSGSSHNLGRFRLSLSGQAKASFEDILPAKIRRLLATPAAKRSDEQKRALASFYRTRDPELAKLRSALETFNKRAPKKPGGQAQAVKEASKVRPTKLHVRGEYLRTGAAVKRGTLDVLPDIQARAGQLDRLDLSDWLLDPQHPLTARVTVNRIWYRLFGRGIVPTIDDFGKQGEPPSHPLLLDWLAGQLIDNGWSIKHVQRLILESATYRQSAASRRTLTQVDPENIWLARQKRQRVESEVIRDLAISASGLWDPRIGGPSVRPPQPAEYSRLTYANSAKWQVSGGGDRYRRGLYTFFQRTSPYPMLLTFDSPDSNTCTAKRSNSNTPIQALTLWNDPVFFEASQALARRVLRQARPRPSESEDAARLRLVVQLCLSRPPTTTELSTLGDLLAEQKKLTAKASSVDAIVGKHTPAGTSKTDMAAWVMICRTILNLDEFITRE